MIQLESEPDIMKFTPSRIPQTPEQTQGRLQALVAKETPYSPLGVWAAERKDGEDFVGWFILLKREMELPDLGFMTLKKHWGMGLTTEIASALLDLAKSLEFKGVTALTDTDNKASIRVLEKLGFSLQKKKSEHDKIRKLEIELNIFEINF
jgi:RimJ/RimL family protein N-acetyltransferase